MGSYLVRFKKIAVKTLSILVSLFMIFSIVSMPSIANAEGDASVDDIHLTISNDNKVNVVVTSSDSDLDISTVINLIYQKLQALGIDRDKVEISGIQGYETQYALVLQDAEAWDSKNVVIDTLVNLGYIPEVKTSSQMAGLDYYKYSHIFITSDQPQGFYNTLNQQMPRLTE